MDALLGEVGNHSSACGVARSFTVDPCFPGRGLGVSDLFQLAPELSRDAGVVSMKNPEAPVGKLATSVLFVAFLTYMYIGLNKKAQDVAWLGIAYVIVTTLLIAYLWVTPKNEPLDYWSEKFSYSPYVVFVGMWLWFSRI
jgi:hypothetical protein